jgi:hypothetical protein
VRVAAHCIDADLEGFVAVEVLISIGLVERSGIEPLTSSLRIQDVTLHGETPPDIE